MTKSVTSISAIAIILRPSASCRSGPGCRIPTRRPHLGFRSRQRRQRCSRASPCLTFNGAYAKTSPGGEIDVLDGGDFGPLQISHALTIANDGAGTAARSSGGGAFLITAGANDAVVLRGLTVNGLGAPL